MRVLSVNVGSPREVQWQGRPVRTSIWKSPVTGPVIVKTLNLDGDQQADLTVHGGEKKAVYVYPSEHYALWRAELPGVVIAPGKARQRAVAPRSAQPRTRSDLTNLNLVPSPKPSR